MDTFQIESGKIVIGDPCYKRDTNLAFPALKGEWRSAVELTDGCVATLTAESVNHNFRNERKQVQCFVDSGQLGFFDFDIYHPEGSTDPMDFENPKSFYDHCCFQTLSDERFGIVLDKGVCSSSGWGDGQYVINYWVDADNAVTKIIATFIDEQDEDEEEEDFFDDEEDLDDLEEDEE